MEKYYDGPVKDRDITLEELDKEIQIEDDKSKKLSWWKQSTQKDDNKL